MSYTDTDDSIGLLDLHLSYKEEEDEQPEGLARQQPAGHLRQLGQRRLQQLLLALTCAHGGDTQQLHQKDGVRDGACDAAYFPPARTEHKFETLEELQSFMNNLTWGMGKHRDLDKLGIINNIKFY